MWNPRQKCWAAYFILYNDVIMGTMASQITSLTIVYSAVYSRNIKAPRHWPLCGEFTGDRWIPRTNGLWWGICFHLMTSSCPLRVIVYCIHFHVFYYIKHSLNDPYRYIVYINNRARVISKSAYFALINAHRHSGIYSISQEICTRFLLCCALLWLYIDWFSHIHQTYFTGTVAI